MKTKFNILAAAILLAAVTAGLGQPIITTQPQHQTNLVGTTATFWVVATGTPTLAHQWQKLSGTWSDLAGCTDTNLCLTNVQTSHVGDYRVVITNVDGAAISDVAHLTVIVPPTITVQPTNFASVSLGAAVGNRVSATGTAPLAYQWCLYGAPVSGQTKFALTLTNVLLADAGDYTVVVTNLAGSVTSRVATLAVDPTFTKITTGPVVTDPGAWSAPIWWDYDNDGFLDLYTPNVRGRDGVYHNNGDGTFSSVTNEINRFLDDYMVGAVADYNNTGLASLLLIHWGKEQGDLYRNNGSGHFTKLTPFYDWFGSGCAGWADYDRDGFIDLFVAIYNGSLNDSLYHNNRNGNFTKMAANQVGGLVADNDTTAPCAWVDYDNDNWPDLWVSSGLDVGVGTSGRQYLWHNNRDGSFSRVSGVSAGSLTNDCATAFAQWADYDNDGYPDVFLGAEWYGTTSLHHNDGGQTFTDVSTAAGVPHGGKSLVQAWGDYDNDGYLDLFVAAYFASNQSILYHNNGDGTFTSIDVGSPLRDGDNRQGTPWADYDNDGFLDLLITSYGDGTTAKQLLYHNNGNGNAWLKVRLVGLASNRSAIGAKVRVQATIRGQTVWQMREINGNSGFSGGACGLLAHFGLGDAPNVTTLRIEWPSGAVQELHNVPVIQYLTVTEPARLRMAQPGQLQIQCWKGMSYAIECSSNLSGWMAMATVTNVTGTLQWTDPDVPSPSARFYRALKQ